MSTSYASSEISLQCTLPAKLSHKSIDILLQASRIQRSRRSRHSGVKSDLRFFPGVPAVTNPLLTGTLTLWAEIKGVLLNIGDYGAKLQDKERNSIMDKNQYR